MNIDELQDFDGETGLHYPDTDGDRYVRSARRALEYAQETCGPKLPEEADYPTTLAELICEDFKFKEAETLFTQTLSVIEKALSPNHRQLADCLEDFVDFYLFYDQDEKAVILLDRYVAIMEAMLGSENPELSSALLNLATILKMLGRHTEALPFFERVLALLEKAGRSNGIEMMWALKSMAGVYMNIGKEKEAQLLLSRADAIFSAFKNAM